MTTIVTIFALAVVFAIVARAEVKLRRQDGKEDDQVDPASMTDNEY